MGIFKRKKHSLIFERVKTMSKVKESDLIIKVHLCPQHKDSLTFDGKLATGYMPMMFRNIANCQSGCKVEYV
jgi:hypothetical protein